MNVKATIELIEFFDRLQVNVEDVSTLEERNNGQKVVIATYSLEEESYRTNKLYSKDILLQKDVKNPKTTQEYFKETVYWLDHEIHHWPRGKGEAEVENIVIRDMVNPANQDAINFFKKLANNQKNGVIQLITKEGRHQQYGFNFENNNHWHDLVLLIKAFIKARGKQVDENLFAPLVFQWQDGERVSLSRHFGSRALIDHLQGNLKIAFAQIDKMKTFNESLLLLEKKRQIILQGPPGTGKTRLAIELAKTLTSRNKSEGAKDGEKNYKIIQFHPAYSYEDFVRGITAEVNENNQIEYKVEDRILAQLAQKALENDSEEYYVLIIDEINRANLPAVFGELILALEYRFNEKDPETTSVDSMYALKEGGNTLKLPKNLLIIGTMNTADRSVGHIDYAIRRRFAFVEMLPEESVVEEKACQEAVGLFRKVTALFCKNYGNSEAGLVPSDYLSPEFRPEDVMIGHSYFLAENVEDLRLKLKYEIKPILKEYLKDGVLQESDMEVSAKEIIDQLHV